MPTSQTVQMTGQCTSCHKTYQLTPQMMQDAAQAGCAFSPCCSAVATIQKVTVKNPKG